MRLAAFGCCTILLLASGCGGSRSSPAAFRARADSICRELGLQNGSLVSTKAGLDRHLREAEAGIDRLARLRPPSGDERSYRDLIATLRRTMSLARTSFVALIETKQPSRRQIERLGRPLGRDVKRADADARAVGLVTCARTISGGSSTSSGGSKGPTPQQVKSPAKRAFDRQMLAVSTRYTNALGHVDAPFLKAFHHGHRAVEKATHTMVRKQVGIYNAEASAIARIKAPGDARAEQQLIANAYGVAAKQEAEFAVSYRHHGHTDLPAFARVDWQGQIKAAVRRLEAKGYALGGFGAIGELMLSSDKSNQP